MFLPYFISWVVVSTIMLNIFGQNGVLSNVLAHFGIEDFSIYQQIRQWPVTVSYTHLIKEWLSRPLRQKSGQTKKVMIKRSPWPMNSSSEKTKMTKTGVVFFCALICCFLWGSAFPCIKIGYGLFSIGASDSTSQIVFAGMRFTLAGILVILFGSLLQGK